MAPQGIVENLMKTPQVSVCIPAYQQPQGVARALQSLREQDYRDYEVIVTDDSADASVESVCREFAPHLPLRYFRNAPPQGTPENWNVAMRHAGGEYIKILHHDDWFTSPSALGAYARMLDAQPDADFAFSGSLNINSRGELVNQRQLTAAQVKRIRQHPGILFCNNLIGAPSATIFRRRANLLFDPQFKWVVDVDFYIRMLSRGQPLPYSPAPLVSVTVQSPQQVTAACTNNPSVEIGEYLALYVKLLATGGVGLLVFNHMLNLFRRFSITDEQAVRACGYGGPIPAELKLYFNHQRRLLRVEWCVQGLLVASLYACARCRRYFRSRP